MSAAIYQVNTARNGASRLAKHARKAVALLLLIVAGRQLLIYFFDNNESDQNPVMTKPIA